MLLPSVAIRTASPADLDLMVEWAAQEGWNPGLRDAQCFRAADPVGFLVATVADEPVACISAVAYGSTFGFVGFYICRADVRGRGYGITVWNAGLQRLSGRVVGLDGVVAQQANYAKSGFVLAHRNARYQGVAAGPSKRDPRIVPVTPELADALVAYDGDFFPAPRELFIRCWIQPDTRHALAFVDGGVIRGYGVIRACRQGHKIGPLFADDETIAAALFDALAGSVPQEEIYLDVPEPNAQAVALATARGLSPVFETARMYRGGVPELPLSRTFGITTFELG